jgi:integrase
VQRRLSAIHYAHMISGHAMPTTDPYVRGQGWHPQRQGHEGAPGPGSDARPAARHARHLPDDLSGLRDRAPLLIGFAGRFRRAALCALDRADITFASETWLALQLGRSFGAWPRVEGRFGQVCSTRAVWRGSSSAAKRAGACADDFSGHSLRSGLATEAARSGATDNAIIDQTGHTDVRSVKRYIRRGRRFTDNVLNTIDL